VASRSLFNSVPSSLLKVTAGGGEGRGGQQLRPIGIEGGLDPASTKIKGRGMRKKTTVRNRFCFLPFPYKLFHLWKRKEKTKKGCARSAGLGSGGVETRWGGEGGTPKSLFEGRRGRP